jgi:hypothetical protein
MLTERAIGTFYIVSRGARVPLPGHLDKLAQYRVETREIDHNPEPEILVDEIFSLILERPEIETPSFSRNLGLKKLDILAFFGAFADQHKHKLKLEQHLDPQGIEDLIGAVEKKSESLGRPLKIPEQLSVALDSSGNNLTKGLICLAAATRVMARNFDKRILPNLHIDTPIMMRWKECVAGFDFNPELQQEMDTAGDTYHFWNAVLGGFNTQQERNGSIYNRATARVLDGLYENTENLTKIRYKIFRKKGMLHPKIDKLGYNVGRLLGSIEY